MFYLCSGGTINKAELDVLAIARRLGHTPESSGLSKSEIWVDSRTRVLLTAESNFSLVFRSRLRLALGVTNSLWLAD